MWWIYFERHNEAASEAIAASDDPGRVARLAYTYIPFPNPLCCRHRRLGRG
jgi:low temperature requirement protein LtrA